jgi:hypothetical protein
MMLEMMELCWLDQTSFDILTAFICHLKPVGTWLTAFSIPLGLGFALRLVIP